MFNSYVCGTNYVRIINVHALRLISQKWCLKIVVLKCCQVSASVITGDYKHIRQARILAGAGQTRGI